MKDIEDLIEELRWDLEDKEEEVKGLELELEKKENEVRAYKEICEELLKDAVVEYLFDCPIGYSCTNPSEVDTKTCASCWLKTKFIAHLGDI